MGKKKRKSEEELTIQIMIYAIFRAPDEVLKVSLSVEEMELELGLGDYDDECHLIEIPVVLMI
jgi:hypothetical protein